MRRDVDNLKKSKATTEKKRQEARVAMNDLHNVLQDTYRHQEQAHHQVSARRQEVQTHVNETPRKLAAGRQETLAVGQLLQALKEQIANCKRAAECVWARDKSNLKEQRRELEAAQQQLGADRTSLGQEQREFRDRENAFKQEREQHQKAREEQERKNGKLHQETTDAHRNHQEELKKLKVPFKELHERRELMQEVFNRVQSAAQRAQEYSELEDGADPGAQRRLYEGLVKDLHYVLRSLGA